LQTVVSSTITGPLVTEVRIGAEFALKMGRKKGTISKADGRVEKTKADGLKHGGVEKTSKLKEAKQASITGFLMAQREPLGEIRANSVDEVKEEKHVVNDAPSKGNVTVGNMIEKKEVKEEMDDEEDSGMVGLCEYEKIRLRNIRQREALFAELALQEAKEEARDALGVGASGASDRRSSRREKVEKDPTEPVRKSLRLAGGKVPEIKRFTFEQFEFLDEQLKSRKIRPEDFYLDDELVSRNIAVEEREKMLEEMATKARTFTGKTERPDGLREVESDRFRILHVPKKCTIKQFVLSNSLEFKCGRGFYEFTKPEIVSHKKEVVVVEKSTGAMFTGKDACRLIGAGSGMRIPPTIFETWQVFVQSTSYGRNLMGGTDFLYEV